MRDQRDARVQHDDPASGGRPAERARHPQPPLVPLTADKYAVRSYVADTLGEGYLIPLLQVVSHADDLDMAALTEPSVIKGTHGCNMTILLPEGAPQNERAIRNPLLSL